MQASTPSLGSRTIVPFTPDEFRIVDLSGAKYLPTHVLVEFLATKTSLKELVLCPFPYSKGGGAKRRSSDLANHSSTTTTQSAIDAMGQWLRELKTLTLGFLLEGEGKLDLSPLGQLHGTLRHLQLQVGEGRF